MANNRASAAAVAAASVLGFVCSVWALPQVTQVTLSRRTYSRIVDISYTLSAEPAIVTLAIATNGIALPNRCVATLSGEVNRLVGGAGVHHIAWSAGIDWPENLASNVQAKIAAWSTNNPPAYLVVDLSAGAGASSYPVSYYTDLDALPDGGLTNDVYRTDRLVMRHVRTRADYPENGVFPMGSPIIEKGRDKCYWGSGMNEDPHLVTLTRDFFIGVFEVTQGQWLKVTGSAAGTFSNDAYRWRRPVETVSYNTIRGSGWPEGGAADGTFLRLLQQKTGLAGFDLPTEAQWEYAYRAGTITALYSGKTLENDERADTNVSAIARNRYNGGALAVYQPYDGGSWVDPGSANPQCSPSNGTAIVGSYLPNAWGLYDMGGNVYEYCLDWAVWHLGTASTADPKGPSTAAQTTGQRVTRGGSSGDVPFCMRGAFRRAWDPNWGHYAFGFRAAMNIPSDSGN